MNEAYVRLDELIEKYKEIKGPLMPILQGAQDIFGAVPEEVQRYIAKKTDIPLADIYGVITFYSQFRMEQRGTHTVSVCMGTACYVKGAQRLLDTISKELKIGVGETSEDREFTLEATRCIGACGLAPIIVIDDEVFGKVDHEDLIGILDRYR
jgi:NADH:ubiquinone oxidoreductase subunit E